MFLAALVGRGFVRQIIDAWTSSQWIKSKKWWIEN
jgi:hypothetical protein